ncbi:AraC family transcriptional regulator [Nocardioides sp. 1609]|uniref:helix-turn-helix domain-containing protein n=1 Tax=Nocardioides sp. 1609 TaxID=2508327 RepID=UPI001ADA8FFE|nr:AraC family transcriptional regulator [Nocardioides sp. 1609]
MSVPGVLAPYVASLVPYDVCGEPGVHIGMPSTCLTLVLAVDEPLDVGWAGGARVSSWANVAGLHPSPAEIRHGRRQRGVYLDLTVTGARALLGLPAGALAGALADVADVDPAMRDLPERLAGSSPDRWTAVVARALIAALSRHDAPAPRAEVGRALARLTRGARVADVAEDVGYSRRHLGDLVRAECGVSPQEYRRLARFERSHALVRDAATSLADAAARCGYADQSHLAREWTAFAGCSPSEWRRRELPSVQAGGPGSAAG